MLKIVTAAVAVISLMAGCASGPEKQARECPIHHVPMREELVVVRNGVGTWEYEQARKKLFPFSGTVYSSSVLPATRQELVSASICPQCMREELRWFKGELTTPEEKKDK